ncbi:hypothetical protein ACP4OV_007562 [Aristida adscensionis]
MWRRRPEAVGGGGPGRGARGGGAVMDGARDARRGASGRRQIAVFVPVVAAAREAEVAPAAADGGHYEADGLVHQETIRDPQMASDEFTYEAAAIRHWLDDGNNWSPMTNLTLRSRDLIPNLALRSSIREYLEQQRQ